MTLSTVPWAGPQWDDPDLTRLARRLRDAHRAVAPLPPETRRRLIRHLLAITDLAKRDAGLAGRRLEGFLADVGGAAGFRNPADPQGAAGHPGAADFQDAPDVR
ncbi:hypothetical protein [Spirillospora albida]|uniref:hypothetical protein n=1 Tax=Spirillospora albida TaxID=58123 RepID=UPI000ACE0096|nr:hypothetical protein [Spirillospora albida]